MITVNVGGLSEGVFESELFGHLKGAFTDAKADRIGRFELADGGTLLLDEIANITLGQQAKLLRVLQIGELERVGSSKTRKVDVRVLSATNADLRAEVAAGRFREDLLYRLNTIEIRLPALRDRREDIPLLATTFLRRHATRYRKPITGFSPAAMQALLSYTWPGNVRELDHTIERAVLAYRPGRNRSRRPEPHATFRRRRPVGGDDARRSGAIAGAEGAGSLRRQCVGCGQGVGVEPKRAVSAAGAVWDVGGAGRQPSAFSESISEYISNLPWRQRGER